MNKKPGKNLDAAVALTTLIVISSILLLTGMTIVVTSIDLSKSTKNASITMQNESQLISCREEALIRLKTDPAYLGTDTITYANGSCDYTMAVHATNPDYRDLTITSTLDEYTLEEIMTVDVSQNPMEMI